MYVIAICSPKPKHAAAVKRCNRNAAAKQKAFPMFLEQADC